MISIQKGGCSGKFKTRSLDFPKKRFCKGLAPCVADLNLLSGIWDGDRAHVRVHGSLSGGIPSGVRGADQTLFIYSIFWSFRII